MDRGKRDLTAALVEEMRKVMDLDVLTPVSEREPEMYGSGLAASIGNAGRILLFVP
jgi:hypothetical protein